MQAFRHLSLVTELDLDVRAASLPLNQPTGRVGKACILSVLMSETEGHIWLVFPQGPNLLSNNNVTTHVDFLACNLPSSPDVARYLDVSSHRFFLFQFY